jgi:hypothetical protein
MELTGIAWKTMHAGQVLKFFVKGGPIRCFGMTARYASAAYREMSRPFSEGAVEAPAPPVSCSALLAQRMGASEMHAAMAAGFAGGIGLSGGACGALAAAIWIIGMEEGRENPGAIGYQSPRALAAMDRFLQSTGFEFECSAIVGRKFENIEDHAGYLRAGGCSKIVEALAAQPV